MAWQQMDTRYTTRTFCKHRRQAPYSQTGAILRSVAQFVLIVFRATRTLRRKDNQIAILWHDCEELMVKACADSSDIQSVVPVAFDSVSSLF